MPIDFSYGHSYNYYKNESLAAIIHMVRLG